MLGPDEAVARYSAAIGASVELVGALTGGETGATAVRPRHGERQVLKWESDARQPAPDRWADRCDRRPRLRHGR